MVISSRDLVVLEYLLLITEKNDKLLIVAIKAIYMAQCIKVS